MPRQPQNDGESPSEPRPTTRVFLHVRTGWATSRNGLLDDVMFVEEIPHIATGKIQKITLRQRFKDYVLPGAQAAE